VVDVALPRARQSGHGGVRQPGGRRPARRADPALRRGAA
jgi:hypothetical protein